MPADSTELAEEGVVIPPHARRRGERSSELAAQMRSPRQRLADLRAQRAANRTGATRLAELAERLGLETLARGMAEILDYAERRTRAALAELPDGAYEAEDVLEDDAGGAAGTSALRVNGDGRRRAADARLHRHRPAGRRATSTARSR